MEVTLKYGKVEESVEVADERLMGIARSPGQMEAPANGDQLIRDALASPVGSPRLSEQAHGKKKVVVLISDPTRPTPSSRLLPFVLEELETAGVAFDDVTVMVAPGLHGTPGVAILEKLVGPDLFSRLKVVVHDPDDLPSLVDLGSTSRGIPVRVNRLVAESDLCISFSTVEPHLLYGWSGGAKNIIPGVSWRQTVYAHHGRWPHPSGGLNRMEGNIFREDAEEAGRMAGLSFIVNVLLNEKRELIGVFAGDPVAAHRAAAAVARKLNVVQVPEQADVVLCAMGGSPRDADFWQAQGKGIMHAGHVVRDGGVLILAVGCENGVGAPDFKAMLQGSMEEIERWHKEQNYSVPLMKASDTVFLLRRASIYLVSPGLTPADFPQLPIRFFSTVKEALAEADRQLGSDSKVLAVPDSSRVVVSLG